MQARWEGEGGSGLPASVVGLGAGLTPAAQWPAENADRPDWLEPIAASAADGGGVVLASYQPPQPLDPHAAPHHVVLLMPPGPDRDLLSQGLWNAGMLVTVFSSPREAEGVLVGQPVQAVLVDVRLGWSLGPQLVHWMRASARAATCVIVLGELAEEQHAYLLAQGVGYCVPRPQDPGAFGRYMAEALGWAAPR
jgi:hypothetical protein